MKSIHSYYLTLLLCLIFVNASYAQLADTTLAFHRKKIDSLDQKLIEIIGERERVVKEVGIYKMKNNIPALQKGRFKQILEKNIRMGAEQGLSAKLMTKVMNAIHEESLRIERAVKKEEEQ
ncbi:chorismate mutase [Pedobacter caeni]|uniref:chorismate mutase n=1 Tax=Pedobacter caeni TaxID=288992 RepID=A0A1M4V0E8_9SPHI|nr:chorismate mutase [Pedobacter caeni]SHE62425.1 Chorismate mutase [Pedobacter caeni]